ncbi:MAG: ATP-binding protein [Bacteroidales bacterium]|nr:ATP-binding protein [Bacteroidales bacterium]
MIEQPDFSQIERISSRRISKVPTAFHRYLFGDIDWNDRLIGIKGPKGSGKSTLICQHIKEQITDKSNALYISLDDLWFTTHDVRDLVEYHYTHGGKYLFLDEVHYFPLWQRLVKNIYDEYSDMKIVFSGSSMLKIDSGEADLSRRLQTYTLNGMSFREYLLYEGLYDTPPLSLDELLKNHIDIAMNITANIKVLQAFERYCMIGYYPFYKEIRKSFEQRLNSVVNQILESDYPTIENVTISTIRKTRKMLMLLAESVPQKVNMSQLFRELETDRNQGSKMLLVLQRSGLVNLLDDDAKSLNKMSKPQKIYLNNTNLMYALTTQINTGTLRETFFLNQTACSHEVCYPKQGDFLIDHKYLFEVGGKSKTFEQIKDIPNSYLAIDGIETGSKNRIPLWMFGLLY